MNNSAVFILAFILVSLPRFLEGFVSFSLNFNCLLSSFIFTFDDTGPGSLGASGCVWAASVPARFLLSVRFSREEVGRGVRP